MTFVTKDRGFSTSSDVLNGTTKHGTIEGTFSLTRYAGNNYEWMEGREIPNFHKRKRAGELLPQTPFLHGTVRSQCNLMIYQKFDTSGNFSRSDGANVGIYQDWGYSPSMATFSDYIPDDDELQWQLQKAASKIYSDGWDMLTFMAELGKTARMFKTVTDNMRKLMKARDKPSAIASAWLEGRYGWRTLALDMQDVAQAVTSLGDGRWRFSQRSGDTSTIYDYDTSVFDDGECTIRKDTEITGEVSFRGSIVADIKPPTVMANVPITAWELVPFSFVIDWWWNVGKAIDVLNFKVFASQYVSSVGYFIDLVKTERYEVDEWDNNYYGTITQDCVSQATLEVRTPTTLSSLPTLNLDWVSPYKLADTVALLIKAFKRR